MMSKNDMYIYVRSKNNTDKNIALQSHKNIIQFKKINSFIQFSSDELENLSILDHPTVLVIGKNGPA